MKRFQTLIAGIKDGEEVLNLKKESSISMDEVKGELAEMFLKKKREK